MSNLIPINHTFQRLYNSALDDTYTFDTIEGAQDYAANNGLAYVGQLLFELIDNMVYKTDISDFIEQFENSFN